MSSALNTSTSVGLSVSQLVINYGNITAVDHISFTAQPGRVTVILGPNGAGKTSTIEACEGFLAPTAGSVQVLGLNPYLQRKQLNRQMGIMLQEGGIYPSARVGELVRQYCALYGNGVDADALISRVGLQSVVSTTYRRLSGGEKQRLSLALALAARPKVVFLDEPTGGVDPITRREFWEMIYSAANRGTTAFVTTHYMDEAEYCNRISIMVDGKIEALGTPSDLKKEFNSATMDDVFLKLARNAKRIGD